MYCMKCGTKNENEARFCYQCGFEMKSDVDTEMRAVQYNANYTVHPHYSGYSVRYADYQQLGGWLAVLAYGHIAAAVFMAISCIGILIPIIELIEYYGKFGIEIFGVQFIPGVQFILLLLALMGYSIYACIHASNLIKRRDSRILRFYEIWCAVNLCGFVVIAIFSKLAFCAVLAISPIFTLILYEAYFRCSLRVRTYFVTDEYLRLSFFSGSSRTSIVEQPEINTYIYKENTINTGETIYCGSCGAPSHKDVRFCRRCGASNSDE